MEKTFDEYNRKKTEVKSNLENYELILDYYLKNPNRIPGKNLKYAIEIITETEKLIRSNTSMYLGGRAEEIEKKVKQLEFLIGKSFVGTKFEVESRYDDN